MNKVCSSLKHNKLILQTIRFNSKIQNFKITQKFAWQKIDYISKDKSHWSNSFFQRKVRSCTFDFYKTLEYILSSATCTKSVSYQQKKHQKFTKRNKCCFWGWHARVKKLARTFLCRGTSQLSLTKKIKVIGPKLAVLKYFFETMLMWTVNRGLL